VKVVNWQGHTIIKSSLFKGVPPYYVTVFTQGHMKLFADYVACSLLVNVLTYNRFALDYRVLGFVIMPDHLHIIFLPGQVPIKQVIMKNTANFSRYYHQLMEKRITVWENDYYQLPVADEETLMAVQKHIHTNPVRQQLVAEPRLYNFSSYRFYHENNRQEFQLLLDQIENTY
jgi:REP element-mobilizing transposase RayT